MTANDNFDLPPGNYDDAKVAALRLTLIALDNEDECARDAALQSEFVRIAQTDLGLTAGIIGYLLRHWTASLERGYGSKTAAVDDVSKELAAAVWAKGKSE
jgi:hypothetical protein